MRKFFVKQENRKEDKIQIIGSDVNHIKNVLRLKKRRPNSDLHSGDERKLYLRNFCD